MYANLDRFIDAQNRSYPTALREIKNSRKTSHWMWYIFPQLKGLVHSEMAMLYAIEDLNEAQKYYAHPILENRLIEISTAVLETKTENATQLMGSPDDLKLRSSMTLFSELNPTHPVFQQVLDKFFNGEKDPKTLTLLNQSGKLKQSIGPTGQLAGH